MACWQVHKAVVVVVDTVAKATKVKVVVEANVVVVVDNGYHE